VFNLKCCRFGVPIISRKYFVLSLGQLLRGFEQSVTPLSVSERCKATCRFATAARDILYSCFDRVRSQFCSSVFHFFKTTILSRVTSTRARVPTVVDDEMIRCASRLSQFVIPRANSSPFASTML